MKMIAKFAVRDTLVGKAIKDIDALHHTKEG